MSGYEQELTIPFFYGKIDTEAYLDWEKKMEFLFGLQYYTEKKKVCLAVSGLGDLTKNHKLFHGWR